MQIPQEKHLPEEISMREPEVEDEIIAIFVGMVQALGFSRSVGEIYGLLYASAQPLTMDEIRDRLDISLGSASQGLKLLRGLGAVRTIYMEGARKDHYEAETELRQLIGGLYREKIEPQFKEIGKQIESLEPKIAAMGANGMHYRQRLSKLQSWRKWSSGLLGRLIRLISR